MIVERAAADGGADQEGLRLRAQADGHHHHPNRGSGPYRLLCGTFSSFKPQSRHRRLAVLLGAHPAQLVANDVRVGSGLPLHVLAVHQPLHLAEFLQFRV